jgi:hypothetical protein
MHGRIPEVQRLRDRVEELEELLGADPEDGERFAVFRIPAGTGPRLLGLLLRRKVVSREAAQVVLYGGRPENQQPSIESLDIHIFRIRKQLRLHKIEVVTVWGIGWLLEPEAKAQIYALIGETAP